MSNHQDPALAPVSSEVDEARERQRRILRAASHDLRGPLANIRSYGSFLKDPRMELSPKAAKAVEVIIRNADRALALLREYIDSEQAARGRLELPVEPLPLRPALEAAAKGVGPLLEERGAKVSLPQTDAVVLAERSALEQILRTLLENAATRGPGHDTLLVRAKVSEDRVDLRFTDHGEPIAGAELDSLFDRDAWLERSPKLGLGFRLSLARTYAAHMGAALEVDSRPDKTDFVLRLPLGAPAEGLH